MADADLALVYGVPKCKAPPHGVWLIHKHIMSGELLGPSVPMEMPTRVVYAELTKDGWSQLEPKLALLRMNLPPSHYR